MVFNIATLKNKLICKLYLDREYDKFMAEDHPMPVKDEVGKTIGVWIYLTFSQRELKATYACIS